MSENRFVSGNVIVVYCNFVELESKELLPQHIMERIAVCTRIYQRIMKSKPCLYQNISTNHEIQAG